MNKINRPIKFLHVQKFHKNHHKILHIIMSMVQKISQKLDEFWVSY
jgi:hypothetical protein